MTQNKNISNLHFITIDHSRISHAEQAIRAYEAGCKWVQLRMKDCSEEEVVKEINKILPTANANHAILLINDSPEIAIKTHAHGVHLGKNDMCPTEARKILGDKYIIGGTANTYEDVISLIEKGVDYVGVGPFRFTSTKKNLSPVIGYEGYDHILFRLNQNNKSVPIIAIGGIKENDILNLMELGVHGIAMASSIVQDENIEANIYKYLQIIQHKDETINYCRKGI